MSGFGRPNANGHIISGSTAKITFPDGGTYTATIEPGRQIKWSNGTQWGWSGPNTPRKEPKKINVDWSGRWHYGNTPIVIRQKGDYLEADMSGFGRPNANGHIISGSTAKITFPDGGTYTATIEPGRRIQWSNGTQWTR